MHDKSMNGSEQVFDYVIIGSGFGGSVSAMRLSEKGYSVLVLERGKRITPTDFPTTDWNLPKFLWLPAARCFGHFGINFFNDLMLLNGNGVGGGSLVYCATHIKPPKAFFEGEEWRDLADWETELAPYYDTANRMLGTAENPKFWPADNVLYEIAEEMGQEHTFMPTPVGIFFGEPGKSVPDPYFNGEGPDRTGCTHCGSCIVGCRHNAKNSLDKNYLYFAQKYGAEVWSESNVLDIRPLYGPHPGAARYEIEFEKITDWFKKRKNHVRARNIIVSAGVLGTLNLLLKCRDENHSLPLLSQRLGQRVRTNSEALMASMARDTEVDYSEGVSISSAFWIDDVTSIEPVRYPPGSSSVSALTMPLISLEGNIKTRVIRAIKHIFTKPMDFFHVRIQPNWAKRNTIILIMQTIDNRMSMKRSRSIWTLFRKNLVTERDKDLPIPNTIAAGKPVVEKFAEKTGGVPVAGINDLLNMPNTAHILGGCGIGKDASSGVIDINHQVFNYPGMYIADGSAIPANLGVNPSLTITAMTERAMSKIPTKKESGQVPPLERPEGLELIENGDGADRSLLRRAAPFMFLALLLPLLFGVIKMISRDK